MAPRTRHLDRISTAMVMANGLATPYRRWGSGRTVLLLGTSEATAVALGDSFRVILPELPLGFSALAAAEWLGGVYEGLGITEAAIVATPVLAAAAWQLRQEAPERVKGIFIVDISTPNAAGLREAVRRSFS